MFLASESYLVYCACILWLFCLFLCNWFTTVLFNLLIIIYCGLENKQTIFYEAAASTVQQVNPKEAYELSHLENVQKCQTGCPLLSPFLFSTYFLTLDSVTENSDVKWLGPWLSQLSACLTSMRTGDRFPQTSRKEKHGMATCSCKSQGWETEAGAPLVLTGKSVSPTW